MNNNINQAIEKAKTPGKVECPVCKEELYAPLDKLSIELYGKCSADDLETYQENNLIKIAESRAADVYWADDVI